MRELRPVYNVLYYIVYTLFGWLVKLVYPLKVIGREHLIKGRGFVLAPNHLRAIDPMYVLLARGFGKKMLIMGKEELFELNPLLNFFWKIVGAFPVDRGTGNKSTIENVTQEVGKGRGLLLFPEGTRSKDGNLGRLKSGAFVVAWQAGADIVPCRIAYNAGGPKLFRRITVVFGPAVTLGEMGLTGEYNAGKLRGAKRLFTQRLEQLYQDNREALEYDARPQIGR